MAVDSHWNYCMNIIFKKNLQDTTIYMQTLSSLSLTTARMKLNTKLVNRGTSLIHKAKIKYMSVYGHPTDPKIFCRP